MSSKGDRQFSWSSNANRRSPARLLVAEHSEIPAQRAPPPDELSTEEWHRVVVACQVSVAEWTRKAWDSPLRREIDGEEIGHIPLRYTLEGGSLGRYCVARSGESGRIHVRWINLNAPMLATNVEHFVESVIPRHLAMVITGAWWKDRAIPYGQEWARVMGVFGLQVRPARSDNTDDTRYDKD